MIKYLFYIIYCIFWIHCVLFASAKEKGSEDFQYLSPTNIYIDSASHLIYISLSTAKKIAVVDGDLFQLEKHIDLPFNPGGILIGKNKNVLVVADRNPEGKIHFLSLKSSKISKSIRTGHTPDAIAITPDREFILVANRFSNTVSVVDSEKYEVVKTIKVEREPIDIAVSGDGKIIAVANNIPLAAGNEECISAKVTLIDRQSLSVVENLKLAPGSQSIEGLVFSKDGRFLYASHVLSRNHLPTTQLKHGWMNTNAVSIIDVKSKKYITSVLLDNFDMGAANPAGMEISEDDNHLYVTLAGTHELCIIDLQGLHKKIRNVKNGEFNNGALIRFEDISGDLRFLYGLKERIKLKGKSPRHVAKLGTKVFISSYFSSELEYFRNINESKNPESLPIGKQPEMNEIRRGEFLFADAGISFQNWQSCITCHPDARADGLNWDLLNDGIGNPKNSKSMLFAHETPPSMITGIRDSAEIAVKSGIKFIHFANQPEEDAKAIDAYLKSLKPVPSPFLVNGKLSEKAITGKVIFEKVGCNNCHSGKFLTNGKKYNVGTGIKQHKDDKFDTPTLIEIWRTAPYLYDGRAKTLKEVLTEYNSQNLHGYTHNLSKKELECLVHYLLTL